MAALVLTPWAILAWNAALILAVAGFIVGFRYWRLGWFSRAFSPPTTFGSSRWATPEDLAENGVLGTTQILPNLLTYQGSVLIIDPKGENVKTTTDRRKAMGQDVRVIDPWNIVNNDIIKPSRFNPLDWLQADDPDIGETRCF